MTRHSCAKPLNNLAGRDTAHGGSLRSGTLAAARLKVTTTLNAPIANKPLRKAQTVIHDAGADNIALVLQGRPIAGNVFAQASLSVPPKAP
jgi:hypothetical protein